MRINLQVPFAEKDAVKALGARWDGSLKVWYIKDVEDLTRFRRWMSASVGLFDQDTLGDAAKVSGPAKVETPETRGSAITTSQAVAHCGCTVLPWLDCIHKGATP